MARAFIGRYYRMILIRTGTALLLAAGGVYILYIRSAEKVDFYRRHHALIQAVHKTSNVLYAPQMARASKLPRYDLTIDPKDLAFLNKNLPPLYQGAILTDEYKQEVPALFKAGGKTYDVNVRYRGDLDNHWRDPQKSWFIDFKKSEYFDRAEKLHLIIPVDRYYLLEELTSYRARKFGLVVPTSKFVNLFVNGKREGVYWQTEAIGKDMLEKQFVPGDINIYSAIDFPRGPAAAAPDSSSIFGWEKDSRDLVSGAVDNFADLNALLDIINNPSDEYFISHIADIVDMDSLYAWSILQYLTLSTHATGPNTRMYFDTTKGTFSFIPWDISRGAAPPPPLHEKKYNTLITRVLSNPHFLHERNRRLWEYAGNEKNLEDDLRRYDELDRETKIDFYKDMKKVESSLAYRRRVRAIRNEIIENVRLIRENLAFANAFVTVRARHDLPQAAVNLGTSGFSAVSLASIEINRASCAGAMNLYEDSSANGIFDQSDRLLGAFQCANGAWSIQPGVLLYSAKKSDASQEYLVPQSNSLTVFVIADGMEPLDLFTPETTRFALRNAITGQNVTDVQTRFLLDSFALAHDALHMPLEDFTKRYPLFTLQDGGLFVNGVTHQINSKIIIPAGTAVHIEPGAKLVMGEGAGILSYSPILALGTAEAPIEISGASSGTIWGTLGIVDASDASRFEYVKMAGGGEMYINGIFMSGMLSLFRSDAKILNSEFHDAHGDDAVNVKYGFAEIRNSRFIANRFDGLDLDVNDSVVDGNTFIANGNDGIDISSGSPAIINNRIERSGDKCISVGENSHAIIFNDLLIGCNSGIVAKDLSSPLIIHTTIADNGIGVSGYRKKQIFGGGAGEIINSVIWRNGKADEFDTITSLNISHSVVQGGYAGEGNSDRDPQLNDAWTANAAATSGILDPDAYKKSGKFGIKKNIIGYSQ